METMRLVSGISRLKEVIREEYVNCYRIGIDLLSLIDLFDKRSRMFAKLGIKKNMYCCQWSGGTIGLCLSNASFRNLIDITGMN